MAAPDRKDSLALIKAAIHRKAARNRENSDVNSLVSDFGYMYVLLFASNQLRTNQSIGPSMPTRATLNQRQAT